MPIIPLKSTVYSLFFLTIFKDPSTLFVCVSSYICKKRSCFLVISRHLTKCTTEHALVVHNTQINKKCKIILAMYNIPRYDTDIASKQHTQKHGGKIMALTSRKNQAVKALQSFMAKAKKNDTQAALEWEMACNQNNQRGHVWDQTDFHNWYARDDHRGEHGATKTCHVRCHNGRKFQNIVVKRHQTDGYIDEHARNPHSKQTGNQLVDEINCWVEFQERDEADYLCPILKYFTSKSDKVAAISEKMQHNVVIIAQKAVYVDDLAGACKEADRLNAENGLIGEDASSRYHKMVKFSREQGWRDAIHNGGNSGVIFDYSKGYYKAVFIDYAL